MSAFVRSKDGEKIQKKLWDETKIMFNDHISQSKMDELFRNIGQM